MPTLAQIHDAVIASVRNSKAMLDDASPNKHFFRSLYLYDSNTPPLVRENMEPSFGSLPAIEVKLSAMNPEAFATRDGRDIIVWDARIWTPHWNLQTALRAVQRLRDALYSTRHPQSTLEPSQPGGHSYISAPDTFKPPGTCFPVSSYRVLQCLPVRIGGDSQRAPGEGSPVFLTTVQFTVERLASPYEQEAE